MMRALEREVVLSRDALAAVPRWPRDALGSRTFRDGLDRHDRLADRRSALGRQPTPINREPGLQADDRIRPREHRDVHGLVPVFVELVLDRLVEGRPRTPAVADLGDVP